MKIVFTDDFDPQKITDSGQCFRALRLEDGSYRFLSGAEALWMKNAGDNTWELSCTEQKWQDYWARYFDMNRSYRELRRTERGKNPWIDRTMDFGRGLRLLRQDPWETLITFILSQRKNIPAIAASVEKLAQRYGTAFRERGETLYTFPAPQALAGADAGGLAACGLGYRAPYVLAAAEKVVSGTLDLQAAEGLDDQALLAALTALYGVGNKVAACVALFAYGRTGCVPVDVWIGRALRDHLGGSDAFAPYGENAGLMQQYVFYWMKHADRQDEAPDLTGKH